MQLNFDEVEKMHDYISSHAVFAAIFVATKLKIAEILTFESAMSIDQLAERLEVKSNSLTRLMRALSGIGLFKEEADNTYTLTSMGALMSPSSPHSMYDLILMWGAEWHMDLWKGLDTSIKSNRPYFVEHFGVEFYEHIRKDPEVANQFHAAMSSLSSLSNKAVASKIDFSKSKIVADIGGGEGGLLLAVLEQWQQVSGILYDIDSAIKNAGPIFAEKGLTNRVQLTAGNFFESVPKNADTYLIKHVLHGLDKQQSIDLLKKIKSTAHDSARIFIVEMVMPEKNIQCYSKFNDLEMMLFSATGRERSLNEFTEILDLAGMTLKRIGYVYMGLHIMEVH